MPWSSSRACSCTDWCWCCSTGSRHSRPASLRRRHPTRCRSTPAPPSTRHCTDPGKRSRRPGRRRRGVCRRSTSCHRSRSRYKRYAGSWSTSTALETACTSGILRRTGRCSSSRPRNSRWGIRQRCRTHRRPSSWSSRRRQCSSLRRSPRRRHSCRSCTASRRRTPRNWGRARCWGHRHGCCHKCWSSTSIPSTTDWHKQCSPADTGSRWLRRTGRSGHRGRWHWRHRHHAVRRCLPPPEGTARPGHCPPVRSRRGCMPSNLCTPRRNTRRRRRRWTCTGRWPSTCPRRPASGYKRPSWCRNRSPYRKRSTCS